MMSYPPPRIQTSAPTEAFPNLELPARGEAALEFEPVSVPAQATPSPDRASQSSASTKSDCSAEERLRWRNHDAQFTPSLAVAAAAMSDPFESYECDPRDGDVNPELKRKGDGGLDEKEREKRRRRSGCRGEDDADGEGGKLSFRERTRHFTWTWFCMTMATGGIANVLYAVPFRFPGLYALGCFFFFLNIVLFIFNVVMISCRFYFFPRTFKASFLHPTESLFIPAAVVSFGIILINISQYGVGSPGVGMWLEHCMIVLFWLDCGLALVFSIGIYLIMWSTTTFTISQMTPIWIFPSYPLLIIGPHAGNLAPKVSNHNTALTIILTGYVIQGIGFLISLMIYAAFIYRLMTQKLPKESVRPGMFVSVGPSGFTISGIITMGLHLPKVVPSDFMGEGNGELAGRVGMICGNFLGLWLWGLALWFFFVSVGAHWSCATKGKMDFAMTWYSFVFPNTALTTATFAIARALNGNTPIRYVGCAMTIALIMMWLFVVAMNIRAVMVHQILWPEKQEDRTEGGWKQQTAEEQRRRQDEENGRGRSWSMVSLSRTFSRKDRGGGVVRRARGFSNPFGQKERKNSEAVE